MEEGGRVGGEVGTGCRVRQPSGHRRYSYRLWRAELLGKADGMA